MMEKVTEALPLELLVILSKIQSYNCVRVDVVTIIHYQDD